MIQQLKKKIESLNNEIKEKDVIISSLETRKEVVSKEKEERKESDNKPTNEALLGSIKTLFEDIKSKLSNIDEQYKKFKILNLICRSIIKQQKL